MNNSRSRRSVSSAPLSPLCFLMTLCVLLVDALGSLSSSISLVIAAAAQGSTSSLCSRRLYLTTALLAFMGTIQLSTSAYVKICTDTLHQGINVGTIPGYDAFLNKNDVRPIRWLKGLSGNLIGPDMTQGGPARAYIYDDSDDNVRRDYLLHRIDGSKDIDPEVEHVTVRGQKYVRLRAEVRTVTGTIYVCALSARIYWSNVTANLLNENSNLS